MPNIVKVINLTIFSIMVVHAATFAENDAEVIKMRSYLDTQIPIFLQGLNRSFLKQGFELSAQDLSVLKIIKIFKEVYLSDTAYNKEYTGDYQALIALPQGCIGLVRIKRVNGVFEPVSLGGNLIAKDICIVKDRLSGSNYNTGKDTLGIFIRDWQARFDAFKFDTLPESRYYLLQSTVNSLAKRTAGSALSEKELMNFRQDKIRSMVNR